MFTAYITDIGTKKKTNQDSVYIAKMTVGQNDAVFAAVCDGMGGMEKGEVASATLCQAFRDEISSLLGHFAADGNERDLDRMLQNILVKVSGKIQKLSRKIGPCGTTVVSLLVYKNRYHVMSLGDSRCYMLHGRKLSLLTHDHSLVQREVDNGRLTEDEARRHPQKNVLLQCVGAGDGMYPDFFHGDIKHGTSFVLCSDGFWHDLEKEEICGLFRANAAANKEKAVENLVYAVEQIKARGETDNISAIVLGGI